MSLKVLNSFNQRIVGSVVIAIVSLFFILTFNFMVMKLLPGDPVLATLPASFESEDYEQAYKSLGLHLPFIQQYFLYLGKLFTGDWGVSYIFSNEGQFVFDIVRERFPRLIEIITFPIFVGLILGYANGKLSAGVKKRGTDRLVQLIISLVLAIPVFWLGEVFQYTLAYQMELFPVSNYKTEGIGDPPLITGFRIFDSIISGNGSLALDTWYHYILPVSILIISTTALISWQIRDNFRRKTREKSLLTYNLRTGIFLGIILTNTILIDDTFNLHGWIEGFRVAMNNTDINVLSALIFVLTIFVVVSLFFSNLIFSIRKRKVEENGITKRLKQSPDDKEKSFENSDKWILERIKSPITIIGFVFIILMVVISSFPQIITPYSFEQANGLPGGAWSPPSNLYPLGQTEFGRDVLARTIYGIRDALLIGGIVLIIGIIGGIIIAIPILVLQVYVHMVHRWIYRVFRGFMIILFTLPSILLIIYNFAIFGQENEQLILILGFLVILIYGIIFTVNNPNIKSIYSMIKQISKKMIIYGVLLFGFIIFLYESIGLFRFSDYHVINLGREIYTAKGHLIDAPWASFWPSFAIFLLIFGSLLLYFGFKENHKTR